jgi:hypothetical protein
MSFYQTVEVNKNFQYCNNDGPYNVAVWCLSITTEREREREREREPNARLDFLSDCAHPEEDEEEKLHPEN